MGSATDLPAASAAPAWGYAIAADGSPIFYESWGARSALAPVIYCDGIGCDGFVWRFLRPELSDRFGAHLHYRGHGRTAPPRDPTRVTIEDLADDVTSVLDDALIDRAVIVGHSMGVQVALETYRRHADRVAGLVLVCGAPSHPLRTFRGASTLEQLLPIAQRWVQRVPSIINRFTRAVIPTRLSYEVATALEVRRELVDQATLMPYLEGISRIDSRLFVAMLAAAGRHSADDLLPSIAVPTLVVAGGRDGFTPPDRSHAMADAIPGSELLEILDGSHTAPIERPELTNWVVRDFIQRRVDGADGLPPEARPAP